MRRLGAASCQCRARGWGNRTTGWDAEMTAEPRAGCRASWGGYRHQGPGVLPFLAPPPTSLLVPSRLLQRRPSQSRPAPSRPVASLQAGTRRQVRESFL